jgi:hypothetical protein
LTPTLGGLLCLEVGVHIIIPYCLRESTVGVTVSKASSPVEFRDTYLIRPERDTRLLNNVFLVSFVTESLQVNGVIRARSGVHTAVLLKIKFSEKRSNVSGYFLTFQWILWFVDLHLGIILVNDQLDAQFFFRICLFQISTCFEHSCAHHQEN